MVDTRHLFLDLATKAVRQIVETLNARNRIEALKNEELNRRNHLEQLTLAELKTRNKVELYKALLLHARCQAIPEGGVGKITSSTEQIADQVDNTLERWGHGS